MAPEKVRGNLVVLDLDFRNSILECLVDRFDPVSTDEPLFVSWNAIECPPGFDSSGNGVIFVARPPGYKRQSYRAKPDALGDHRYSWADKVYFDGIMIVLILPEGYVIRSIDSTTPSPTRMKMFGERLAWYWAIPNERDRAEVSWQINPINDLGITSLSDHTETLNNEAVARGPLSPPVKMDEGPVDMDIVNPQDEPAIIGAPSWHKDKEIESIRETNQLLKLITNWTFITGIILSLIGLAFVLADATGTTSFNFFGQRFDSTNVGIAAIFLGVAMIVLNIRRLLKVAERRSS